MEAALAFVGILVSLLAQVIKKYTGTSSAGTLLSVAVLAILGAFGAEYIAKAGYLEALYKILATAGAFYAFIVLNIEKSLK
jgi:uncharacterized membrane protein YeaQ/YmgE (transglycosylase-associated protein family)